MNFAVIVACTLTGGIGYNNTIPWDIPEDLKYFKYITTTTSNPNKINAVIMGRNTWNSIGNKPLKNRLNIIVSSTLNAQSTDVLIVKSLDEAYAHLAQLYNIENVFAIGGSRLYNEAISDTRYNKVYLTLIMSSRIQCDAFFPVELMKKEFYVSDNSERYNSGDEKYMFFKYERYSK